MEVQAEMGEVRGGLAALDVMDGMDGMVGLEVERITHPPAVCRYQACIIRIPCLEP